MKARFFAVVALLLGLAACQSEPELVNPVFDGEVDYSLTVGVQELATRADLDGDGQETLNSAFGAIDYFDNAPSGDYRIDWSNVDLRYILEVYDFQDTANGASYDGKTPIKDRQVKILDKYEPVVFDLRLVPGRKYHFVVFADFVDNGKAALSDAEKLGVVGIRHSVGTTLADIKVINEAINDEAGDAYFAVRDIEINNSATEPITLTRPYGKLRVVATDLAELNLNVHPGSTVVEYEAFNPNTFNAVTGKIGGTYAVKSFTTSYVEKVRDNMTSHYYNAGYDAEKVKAVDNVTERNSHITLFTDYILANNEQSTIHFTMTVNDGAGAEIKTTKFNTEIPVQRNYLTTIIGNVLTTSTEIKITIDDNFENGSTWNPDEDDFDISVWDGKTLKEPALDGNIYTIYEASELAWLAAAVNGTLETRAAVPADSFNGKTFELKNDIDLNGELWTPIGTSSNSFQGTFDGGNFTIYNLAAGGEKISNVGLFGFTTNGEIKNLVIENAAITGRLNVGVVAGTPYTSKYNNITVKGHIEVNGMSYVGAVGGKNAYANWDNITVEADATSYVYANSIENGVAYRTYVGGVCGFNGEGGHSFTNIRSNIDVIGTTCDVGGLFGIAHYGNQFENCVCTGDVEITEAEEAEEAQEIGGIAGVWNNGGSDVVFNNVEFTGTLTTNIDVDYYYGGLVGKPYNTTGKGAMILNGIKYTAEGADLSDINKTLAEGGELVFDNDIEGKSAASNSYGKTGLNQLNGGVIDGNGHTLSVKNANGTWDSAINTTGGVIKNLTIDSGFRGIFVNHNSVNCGKVYLDNVTIDGPVYTISCDQGTNSGLEAVNSTFKGWTSYAATIGNVYFKNCLFGEGAGYQYARPYAPTVFENCEFEAGFKMDPRATVTFVNCTLAGVALTNANLSTLVISNIDNAKFPEEVSDDAALKAALDGGSAYVEVAAGVYNTLPASSLNNGVTLACEDGTVFTGNSSLNINGATVIGATFNNDSGTVVGGTINGTFKNCTFDGSNALRYCYAGETVVFEDCEFDGNVYGVHFDGGANDVTFRRCLFSGFNAFGSALTQLTLEDCTFKALGNSGYNGANLWGSTKMVRCEFTFDGTVGTEWIDCIGADKTYSFEDCTVNGVPYTPENYTEYGDIFSRNNVTVKINGEDCAM